MFIICCATLVWSLLGCGPVSQRAPNKFILAVHDDTGFGYQGLTVLVLYPGIGATYTIDVPPNGDATLVIGVIPDDIVLQKGFITAISPLGYPIYGSVGFNHTQYEHWCKWNVHYPSGWAFGQYPQ
jgi:hypothetical protein